ncbi:hypothetical protein BaRGS_00006785 [Batillaria attramentaria]|uniref:Uncharacterized protein n=1 Tax=Batillaria attramentaria TaxID=370345 RepID=A0ABD0LS76_9CAEN
MRLNKQTALQRVWDKQNTALVIEDMFSLSVDFEVYKLVGKELTGRGACCSLYVKKRRPERPTRAPDGGRYSQCASSAAAHPTKKSPSLAPPRHCQP